MASVEMTAAQVMGTVRGNADGRVGVHQASAALEAAGAFNDPDVVTLAQGTRRVAFWITYTMNVSASSGSAHFRIEWTDADGNTAIEPVNNAASLTVAQPYANMQHYLGQFPGPIAQSVTPIRWPVVVDVPPGAVGVRLLAAELTDTTNMGNVQVEIAASGML